MFFSHFTPLITGSASARRLVFHHSQRDHRRRTSTTTDRYLFRPQKPLPHSRNPGSQSSVLDSFKSHGHCPPQSDFETFRHSSLVLLPSHQYSLYHRTSLAASLGRRPTIYSTCSSKLQPPPSTTYTHSNSTPLHLIIPQNVFTGAAPVSPHPGPHRDHR